ncbi:hypothetical protein RvY_02416 [Ramazzottius varieornatus]|uniref:Uncharacterized protein n=1 Tax=Ramazzottius varieornatus TaxID=947166 RepID=A0A1D1UJL7_RAMVA|nr:hypothetical protein RvY_02416 [Ramazzottius varieornatus]
MADKKGRIPRSRLEEPDDSLEDFELDLLYGDNTVEESRSTRRHSSPEVHPTSSSRSSDNFPEFNARTWALFQDAAASTSRLYQTRASGRDALWYDFGNAASSISLLYKESSEQQQRAYDLGYREGVDKAYSELMEWLVQDPMYHPRKNIRAEDLVAFIYSPKNRAVFNAKLRNTKPTSERQPSSPKADYQVRDFQTFRDALHVSSLDASMSRVSVNRSPSRSTGHSGSPPRSRPSPVDLHTFVTEEFRRHKRSNSSAFSYEMDQDESYHERSPKRSRFSPSQ